MFRNEIVRTGADSTAKLVFLDSTNLGVGPVSTVTLDQFVYVGESNGQKMTVNLAKGVFRFTTGALDKKAYEIQTPTAVIGVRGAELYGDAMMSLYGKLEAGDPAAIESTLKRYAIAWTIFPPEARIVGILDREPGWRRLYADGFAVVQARDGAPAEAAGLRGD